MTSYVPFDMRICQTRHMEGASTLRLLLYSREANLIVNIIGHAFKAMQGELGTMQRRIKVLEHKVAQQYETLLEAKKEHLRGKRNV
jgi:hypothetical protein